MWIIKFFLGMVFIISFCLVLISLMRDASGSNNDYKWEAKFRLYAMSAAAVSFGLIIAML